MDSNYAQCRTKYSFNRSGDRTFHKLSPKKNLPQQNQGEEIQNNSNYPEPKVDLQRTQTQYSRKSSNHSQHSHSNGNPFESNLLCQDCINQYLASIKRNQFDDNSQPVPAFEDKMKSYTQNYINKIINSREAQSQQVRDSLPRFEYSEKDAYINKCENGVNSFNKFNNNYDYERAKRAQEEKEKLFTTYKDRYVNRTRPEIESYFAHYVDGKNGTGADIGLMNRNYEAAQKEKEEQFRIYQRDLLKQIDYKKKLDKEQNEVYQKEQRDAFNEMLRKQREEDNAKELEQRRIYDDCLRENLDMIKRKQLERESEENEKREYNEKFARDRQRENEEDERRAYEDKIAKERYMRDNLDLIEKERNKRRMQREEDEKYQYQDKFAARQQEDLAECMKCHRIFPRRLLTVNRNFYTNKGR